MIAQWIAITVLVFIGLVYLKLEHHGKKIQILIVLIIGLVIYFSIVGHFTSEKVDMTSPKGVVKGIYLYFGWMGQTASNLWDIGVDTTRLVGNAIKINRTEEEDRR